MKTLYLLAAILFMSVNAYSQYFQLTFQPPGPIVPDRPGQTNPPNVVGTGVVQLETG
jgi:hypothetical protein